MTHRSHLSAFFAIFFIGMSLPMSASLASHMVGYNMTWSTTVKTVEKSNFFLQLPIIWKRFWPQLIFFGAFAVSIWRARFDFRLNRTMQAFMLVSTSQFMPVDYRVANIEVTFPMGLLVAAHLLWPFALNPWFLSFSVSYDKGDFRADRSSFRYIAWSCIGWAAHSNDIYFTFLAKTYLTI